MGKILGGKKRLKCRGQKIRTSTQFPVTGDYVKGTKYCYVEQGGLIVTSFDSKRLSVENFWFGTFHHPECLKVGCASETFEAKGNGHFYLWHKKSHQQLTSSRQKISSFLHWKNYTWARHIFPANPRAHHLY